MLKPQDLLVSCKILCIELRSINNGSYPLPRMTPRELEGVVWELREDDDGESARELAVIEEFLKSDINRKAQWNYRQLSSELFISLSEANKAVARAVDAKLLLKIGSDILVNRSVLESFIRYGVPVVFNEKAGAVARGIPTAHASPTFKKQIASSSDLPPVWPYPLGKARGVSVNPLYKSAAKAAVIDVDLYALLSIIDVFRIGDSRSQEIAVELLSKIMECR